MAVDPKLIFITGKGGTGKSTLAAALALSYARRGLRVQLIELGGRSFFASGTDTPTTLPSEEAAIDGFDGVELFQLDPMNSLKQYLKRFTLFESAVQMLLDTAPARGVLNTLPGLKELAILGKLTQYLEPDSPESQFDVTVVDAFATGHFLALLRAPKALAESISSGPMGQQCQRMLSQLSDMQQCRYLIATLPGGATVGRVA